MASTLPLVAHAAAAAAAAAAAGVILHDGSTIHRRQFAAAALALAERLPAGPHAINLCQSRLGFLLAFAAACLRGQITLLPPNQTAGVLADLQRDYPGHVVDDSCISGLDLTAGLQGDWPQIPVDRIVAVLFTSGTTGTPQAQPKTWGMLAGNGLLDARRFLTQPGTHVVATVPPQHMFGLQMSVMLPLMGDCTVVEGRPFFAADLRATLQSAPAPRLLVTTPMHLRSFLDAGLEPPSLERIVSATAPLPRDLAERAERSWNTQVFEIYGSTEAGTIATRRVTEDECWQTVPGGSIRSDGEGTVFTAPHLPQPIALQDLLEQRSQDRFLLRGRAADLVKVGGKRASLAELTRELLGIPGVRDGVVFLPGADSRPAALVVAPGIARRQILAALGERIDAVFMPRPLLLVDALPRNPLGKLSQAELLKALARHRSAADPS